MPNNSKTQPLRKETGAKNEQRLPSYPRNATTGACSGIQIVVDIRESVLHDKLLEIVQQNTGNEPTIVLKPLHLGDIALETADGETLVLFERKTLNDLISSIKDGRYVEQSHRLIHSSNVSPHNIAYVIEGMYSQLRKDTDKQMCISAITTMFYFKGFSVFRTCSVFETAELILGIAKKTQKELSLGKTPRFTNTPATETECQPVSFTCEDEPANATTMTTEETPDIAFTSSHSSLERLPMPTENIPASSYCEVVHKVKKDNITPENIGEIILCSIPGISSATAMEIMKHYVSFAVFMEEIKSRPEKLETIYLTTNDKRRKLGKNIIANIKRFLT
jgi:ERCC4-type nuclease